MKTCRDCEQEKPLEEFYKNKNYRKDGRDISCKVCRRQQAREYRDNNLEVVKARNREYSRKRYGWKPAQSGKTNRERTLAKYGLTVEDYEEMYSRLNGTCPICDKEFDRLVVDHDHKTGNVRGLICRACNRGLGMFGDDLLILQKAYNYMVKYVA